MVAQKEPYLKLKSSSKTKTKTKTKPFVKLNTTIELKKAKEPKSFGFSTIAKNRSKPSQSKPASCASKCLKVIAEEFTKDKTPYLVDKNSK